MQLHLLILYKKPGAGGVLKQKKRDFLVIFYALLRFPESLSRCLVA